MWGVVGGRFCGRKMGGKLEIISLQSAVKDTQTFPGIVPGGFKLEVEKLKNNEPFFKFTCYRKHHVNLHFFYCAKKGLRSTLP